MRARRKRSEKNSAISVATDDLQLPPISPRIASASRYLSAQLGRDDGLPSRLAFTSAISGEGVSFVSMAFASTLAHDTRQRVGLVQLNWWNKDAGLSGLSDVILRDAQLEDVILDTSDSCLAIIPSGYANGLDRAVLARDGTLEKLLNDLGNQYDHLVLDLPAVLLTSDSVALADLADTLALVVRHGVTSYDQVEAGVRQFDEDRISGIILNQEQSRIPRIIRRRLGL
jgi:Mrp family chromosome partitioning ATPase